MEEGIVDSQKDKSNIAENHGKPNKTIVEDKQEKIETSKREQMCEDIVEVSISKNNPSSQEENMEIENDAEDSANLISKGVENVKEGEPGVKSPSTTEHIESVITKCTESSFKSVESGKAERTEVNSTKCTEVTSMEVEISNAENDAMETLNNDKKLSEENFTAKTEEINSQLVELLTEKTIKNDEDESALIPLHVRPEVEEMEDDSPVSPTVIELFDDDDDLQIVEDNEIEIANSDEIEKMNVDKAEAEMEIFKNESKPDKKSSIFFGKECINFECKHNDKNFIVAPNFVLNSFKVPKKSNRIQYVCEECFEASVTKYEELCTALCEGKPLYLQHIPKRQDFVEILDSSDEDENDEKLIADGKLVFDSESIELIQNNLDEIICDVLSRVEINKQMHSTKNILSDKMDINGSMSDEISKSLEALQKKADYMHNSLYQCPKIKIKELQPLDLNTGRPFLSDSEYNIPPLGELKYPRIEIGGIYYAARNKAIGSWLPSRVIESVGFGVDKQKSKYYKVKFIKLKIPAIKSMSPKCMAYGEPPDIRLKIGTRVIALFDASTLNRFKDKSAPVAKSAFYPGVIAEELQAYNRYRYLIFFDDGYAQYVQHKDVRVVCEAAENVWDDVHEASREFIRTYLNQDHKNRPMVQVKRGQNMMTESNGKWLYAKAVDVDASLVQVYFSEENRCEWIYLGSTRLGPLFKEKQKKGSVHIPQMPRRSEPYVRYFQNIEPSKKPEPAPSTNTTYRAVAKKSTARTDVPPQQPTPPVKHLNNSTIFLEDDNRPKGKVVFYTAKKNLPPKRYVPHHCSPKCLYPVTHNLSSYSPLAKPLLSGWERTIFKSKLKKFVVYRGPCGIRLRSMADLHRYLRLTKNSLNVENFDFDCLIHCLAEYVIETNIVQKADLSNGVENMIIPCINYYDNTMPPECVYSTKRIPTEGVNLNLDRAFLAGCDCEDDCSDKTKCSCWKLTLLGTKFGNPNSDPDNVGYCFKRLPEPVPTGIYECNINCKCSKNCLNRVVQQPLQMKLQVFKTSNRGWGLRCLNDVPKGSFICIYAGHLLTEQNANEGGAHSGDEYFAELDYIEVVERLKEGYESDIPDDIESDEELDEPTADNDSDEEFRSSASFNKDASINTRLRAKRGVSTDVSDSRKSNDDDSIRGDKGSKSKKGTVYDEDDENENCNQERQVISFEPNTSLDNEETTTSKYKSIRKLYGKNEYCFIMDAKKTGNIGRYFNHSCSPNLFVQNVFVDSHDLRFPWVAFFALSHIRAGTELTWNYNYEVGIVPGKVLYCECGAPNCRGRLL